MKATLYTLAFLIGLGGLLKAQDYGEDSLRCRENLYIYYELAKKRQFLEAYDSWQIVYDICPGSSKNNFIYGPYIAKAKIDQSIENKDTAAERKFKNLLMEVYDRRNEIYPGNEADVATRKALDFFKYNEDKNKEAHDLFKYALEIGGPEQPAAFYNYYFITAARLFNEKVFEVEDVFRDYNLVNEGIEVNNNALNVVIEGLIRKRDSDNVALDTKELKELEKAERELERYTVVESNIEKILGPIATCDKLNLIYNAETFAANKSDTLWLKRAAKMLQKERKNEEGEYEDCTDNPIFFNISEELYKLQPSAPSARAMFIMSYRGGDYAKATQYIKEAINFELDPIKRSADYLKLASIYIKRGSLAQAKSACINAANLDKKNGDPYVMLATIYAAADGSCGSNVFEKKAVYWAAIDKLNYAKSIDASVSNKANRLINAYKQQLPDKSASFQLGHVGGEKYTIGCWINETITVAW
tara:strand:+ start:297 stop:1715 length:1419 start_codon:yes stop_codon:yes gene_type:complete